MRRKTKHNLDNVDIQAVLDDLRISYTTRGKNVSKGWIGTNCPFPGCSDKSNHLGLCLDSPVVSCFLCGKSGNYLSFLAAKLGSWNQAVEVIKKHSPRELKRPNTKPLIINDVKVEIPKEATKTPTEYQKYYIEGVRRFSLEEMEAFFDFYYCPPFGRWQNRIIVPLYYKNDLVTFTSIDIGKNTGIRYLHLSEEESKIHCKHLLLGYDQVIGNKVIVVEGFFDKARIGTNCVCTFGSLVTKRQVNLLTKFAKVYVAFDGDKAGLEGGKKLAEDLAGFTEVEMLFLPEESDPDKLSKEDINYLRQLVKVGF